MQLDGYSVDPLNSVKMLNESGKTIGKKSFRRQLEKAPSKSKAFYDELVLSARAKGLNIADLSKVKSSKDFTTGDLEQDKLIKMGLEYKKSCFDFTNAKEFSRLTAEQEEMSFEGMSKSEKYKAIYEKYQYCYGENFLDAQAIEYVSPPSEYDGCMSIIRKFNDEISRVCGNGIQNAAKARREALYGDMNEYEIRQTILDKYSQNGSITQKDLFKAANEMDMCGVGHGIRNALNPIGNPFIYRDGYGSEHPDIRRERQLDMPVTEAYIKNIEKVYENRISVGGYADEKIFTVLGELLHRI